MCKNAPQLHTTNFIPPTQYLHFIPTPSNLISIMKKHQSFDPSTRTPKVNPDLLQTKLTDDYNDGQLMIADEIGDFPEFDTIRMDMLFVVQCRNGSLRVRINGMEWECGSGNIVVGMPNVLVSDFQPSEDLRCRIIAISYEALQNIVNAHKDVWMMINSVPNHPVFELNGEILSIIESYFNLIRRKIAQGKDTYRRDVIYLLVAAFFHDISDRLRRTLPKSGENALDTPQRLMSDFQTLLSDSDGRHRQVQWYADQLCVTPKYLSAVCKSISGRTAKEWVQESALEVLVRKLRKTSLSIKEVAQLLEFPNISVFGKYTQAHLGMSPTQIRQSDFVIGSYGRQKE